MEDIYASLQEIIEKLKNDDSQDLDREEILQEAGRELSTLYDIKEFKYQHCGVYDGPGYTVHYYAIAFIDEDRELGLTSYQFEYM